MEEYIKLFNTDSARVEYEDSENYLEPYVSYVEEDNTVHYNKSKETRLVVRYNVEDASQPTQLYAYVNQQGAPFTVLGADMFSKIEIDGTEVAVADLDTASGQTQFSVGEHTVKYTLIDPTFIGIEINNWTLTRLGAVFPQCQNIISVEIPNSVTSISNAAFQGCSGLASIAIPDSVTSIGSLTSTGDENIGAFEKCTSLTSITIPNSVTSIGKNAFAYCYGLTSVTIPNSVEVIGPSAFLQLYFLTSVTIGNSVTSIGDSAFADCTSLTNITIPNSVTSIGDYAFQNCSNLTSVTIEATTPPTLGSDTFYDTNNCPIYVPAGTSNTYKEASGWSDYASRIYGIGETRF